MGSERFERPASASRMARLLAGAMAVMAASGAWAGSESGSFGVGLRITASCQVDSAAVVEAVPGTARLAPDVSCGFATPRSVQLTREHSEAPVLNGPSTGTTGDGSVLVVTLTF